MLPPLARGNRCNAISLDGASSSRCSVVQPLCGRNQRARRKPAGCGALAYCLVGPYYFPDFESGARSANMEPIAARARSDAEIEAVVTSLGGEPGGGLVIMPDYFMLNHVRPIILLAARNNIPAIYPWRSVVADGGGLISYGPDLRDVVRRGAPYVDRILRGEKPADLPVQVPVKLEMAVNTKTAKALRLTVPPSILVRADEVIE
jgi:putative ABC transport system substrate-binding protein